MSLHGGEHGDALPRSVLEEYSLIVNQVWNALWARSSIAISKVVSHMLHTQPTSNNTSSS